MNIERRRNVFYLFYKKIEQGESTLEILRFALVRIRSIEISLLNIH
jgi:hypothetical protein